MTYNVIVIGFLRSHIPLIVPCQHWVMAYEPRSTESIKSSQKKSKQFSGKNAVFLVEDPPLTMLLVRYQPGTASTREVEQGQKIRRQFGAGSRQLRQLGKVITPENTRPGSRPLLRLNCGSAEACHGFKCGNLRGRGRACSGWSEGDQPGVTGPGAN